MKKEQRYTFSKTEKLKSRKDIELLFAAGKSFSNFPFRVVYLFAADEKGKQGVLAGFSVSAKQFKKATDRNRIKRQMREAYRLQKNTLTEVVIKAAKKLNLFFIYTGNELPEYKVIVEKTGTTIKRLIKITNETDAANT
jgi:ribonuclease P protein component